MVSSAVEACCSWFWRTLALAMAAGSGSGCLAPRALRSRSVHSSRSTGLESFSRTVPFWIITRVGDVSMGQKAERKEASCEPESMRRSTAFSWIVDARLVLEVSSSGESSLASHSRSHVSEASSSSGIGRCVSSSRAWRGSEVRYTLPDKASDEFLLLDGEADAALQVAGVEHSHLLGSRVYIVKSV